MASVKVGHVGWQVCRLIWQLRLCSFEMSLWEELCIPLTVFWLLLQAAVRLAELISWIWVKRVKQWVVSITPAVSLVLSVVCIPYYRSCHHHHLRTSFTSPCKLAHLFCTGWISIYIFQNQVLQYCIRPWAVSKMCLLVEVDSLKIVSVDMTFYCFSD